MAFRALLSAIVLLVLGVGVPAAQERYLDATVNAQGLLQLVVANGAPIVLSPERPSDDSGWKQVGFSGIAIATGGSAVGWLALFTDCGPPSSVTNDTYCPSYPTKLAVYENGRTYTFGDGVPIWKWAFIRGGTQVGFMRMTLHGADAEHYELREVRTGQLVERYAIAIPPESGTIAPDWVRTVASQPTVPGAECATSLN